MSLVEKYIFRLGLAAFLAALSLLTGVIWVTQIFRELDVMIAQGQTLLTFLGITVLTLPSLVLVIAPVALFMAVLFSLNKLNGDSELVVMSAAGLSPARLMRPVVMLTLVATFVTAVMSLWAVPWAFYQIRVLSAQIYADYVIHVAQEGEFTTLDQGVVFHFRARGENDRLFGVFIQDRRDPEQVSTYLAETGSIERSRDQIYLVLQQGTVLRQKRDELDPAIVSFQSYAFDLSQFGGAGQANFLQPRERSTLELLTLDASDPNIASRIGSLRSELLDRFVSPLFAMMFGMIAFAALGQPQTTRTGRGAAIAVAVAVALGLRIAGFGASVSVSKYNWAVWLDFGLPCAGLIGATLYSFWPPFRSALSRVFCVPLRLHLFFRHAAKAAPSFGAATDDGPLRSRMLSVDGK